MYISPTIIESISGTFNPLLIRQLFQELTVQWALYTREHTDNMWLSVRTAVVATLETLTEKHVMDVCLKKVIDPELDTMQKALDKCWRCSSFLRHLYSIS